MSDLDGDGIPDVADVCPTNADVIVDIEGRPWGDLDGDCMTNLNDFRMMQLGWTGDAEFDVVGVWDAFSTFPGYLVYYGRYTFYASHLLAIDYAFNLPDDNVYYTVAGNKVTTDPSWLHFVFNDVDSMMGGTEQEPPTLFLYRR